MVRPTVLLLLLSLGACSSPAPWAECLDIVVENDPNIVEAVDELRGLPARRFAIRLDSADITTPNASGKRLGLLSTIPDLDDVPPGVWRLSTPDSMVAVWWGGFDGVRLELSWEGDGFIGRGIQGNDAGCPGSEFCYEGRVTATPIACPAGPWLQADSLGWIPWRS